MNKVILISLLLLVPTAFAVTCQNDEFATFVGLEALTTSVTGSGLAYCRGLEGENICCSAATINSIQSEINDLFLETVTIAAARDTYLLGIREALADKRTKFQTLQTNALAAITALTNGQTPNANAGYASFQTAITESGVNQVSTVLESALNVDYSDYQEFRATCANKLFEAQGATMCLSCRPAVEDYATYAQATGLKFTSAYDLALKQACKPYLDEATNQNWASLAYIYLDNVDAISTLLASVAADVTQATPANLATFNTLTEAPLPTKDSSEGPTRNTCPSTGAAACTVVTFQMLNAGLALVPEYVGNGGVITIDQTSTRRLLSDTQSRQLSAVDFNPTSDANASGVAVDFPEDPIAYLAAGAWRQGGLMACVASLVAMLLF